MIAPENINDSLMTVGRYGNSSNPHVVLLHGLFEDQSMWNSLIPQLEDDYYLIVPDMRAHGMTLTSPNAPMSLDDFVNDILRLNSGLPPAVIVGHSFGGAVAQKLAQLHTPTSLILCNTIYKPPQMLEEAYRKIKDTQKQIGVQEFKVPELSISDASTMAINYVKKLRDSLQPPAVLSSFPAYMSLMLRFGDVPRNAILMKMFENGDFYNFNLLNDNKKITARTLVIGSTKDDVVSTQETLNLANSIKGAEVKWVEGTHVPIDKDEFFDTIAEFLQEE